MRFWNDQINRFMELIELLLLLLQFMAKRFQPLSHLFLNQKFYSYLLIYLLNFLN